MSLPISGNRTLAAAQRVSRADVLSIQDSQVAGYGRGMRAARKRQIPALLARGLVEAADWTTIAAAYYRQATGGSEGLIFPVMLPVGAVVSDIEARIYGGGVVAVTAGLIRIPLELPVTAVAITGLQATGASLAAWATILATATAPGHAIEAGYRYWIRVVSGQSGDRCLWTRATWHRP